MMNSDTKRQKGERAAPSLPASFRRLMWFFSAILGQWQNPDCSKETKNKNKGPRGSPNGTPFYNYVFPNDKPGRRIPELTLRGGKVGLKGPRKLFFLFLSRSG